MFSTSIGRHTVSRRRFRHRLGLRSIWAPMIRTPIRGLCVLALCSERRLRAETQVGPAYRRLRKLGIQDGQDPIIRRPAPRGMKRSPQSEALRLASQAVVAKADRGLAWLLARGFRSRCEPDQGSMQARRSEAPATTIRPLPVGRPSRRSRAVREHLVAPAPADNDEEKSQ